MNNEENIRAEINALEVDENVSFPIERIEYVLSCRNRLQSATGKKFTSKRNKEEGIVVITRIATEQETIL